jgi:hypothetical protein
MVYVENVMNLVQEIIGVNLCNAKRFKEILKIGLMEIKILMN